MEGYRDLNTFRDKYKLYPNFRESTKKPKIKGQLFLKDFFKLQPSTELLFFVCTNDNETSNVPIQFIETRLSKDLNPNFWCIVFRDKDGIEYMADLYDFGALQWCKTWGHSQWSTLKE